MFNVLFFFVIFSLPFLFFSTASRSKGPTFEVLKSSFLTKFRIKTTKKTEATWLRVRSQKKEGENAKSVQFHTQNLGMV